MTSLATFRKPGWETSGDDHFAQTVAGEYHVGLVGEDHVCTLLCVVDGMALTLDVAEGGKDDVLAAAQVDFEARVLKAFEMV